MRSISFKVFEGADGQFYARLRSSNGRITWQSEGYKRVAGAMNVCISTWRHIREGAVGMKASEPAPFTKDSLKPVERKAH